MSSDQIRVVFFGDSICAGQYVSIHHNWVTRISAYLAELGQKHSQDILVINASVNGDTTRLALERMPYHVQSQRPDIMIVQFGMNDCNYWKSDCGNPRVSKDAFRANIVEILNRGFACGVQQALLNTNHPTTRTEKTMEPTSLTYEFSNRQYNQAIREALSVADNKNVIFNDVESEFERLTSQQDVDLGALLLSDGLHLSERGHDAYFSLVYPGLAQAVEKVIQARG